MSDKKLSLVTEERSPGILMEEEISALGQTHFLAAAPRVLAALQTLARESDEIMEPIAAFEDRATQGECGWHSDPESPWKPEEQRELDALRSVVRQTVDLLVRHEWGDECNDNAITDTPVTYQLLATKIAESESRIRYEQTKRRRAFEKRVANQTRKQIAEFLTATTVHPR